MHTGLEPTTSCVTGRHSNQSELMHQINCGAGRIRTCDLQVMSLTSYLLLYRALFFSNQNFKECLYIIIICIFFRKFKIYIYKNNFFSFKIVRLKRLELSHLAIPDPKSGVSTNSTTSA